MEGDAGPQVAVYDSFGCGSAPHYQYQFLPGKGCENICGAKQAGLSGRLNLNFDNSCSPSKEQRFKKGLSSSPQGESGNWEGFSFMGHSDTENGFNAGEPVKNRESEGVKRISPSDLRLDFALDKSLVTASDSQQLMILAGTEQKRKQSLFNNGSPTHQISSMNAEDSGDEDAGTLTLKLCPGSYSYTEDLGNSLWNSKRHRSSSPGSQSPACQVDDCSADLKHAKDYHRRHKVCEMHSKAPKSLVHGLMQRFCQQCSRFHPLHEFDEGKRSCRRRLAGHNKRRRKPHPDVAPTGAPSSDAVRGSELLNLFAILSQLQSSTKEKLDTASKEWDTVLQGVKKTNLFLPVFTSLTRDATPAACALNSMRQTSPQTLPGVSHLDQESQTGLLSTLAMFSPEELSIVLRNGLGAQVTSNQGKVQQPQLPQQISCKDQSLRPLFSSGLRNSEDLQNASNGTVERTNIQCTRPFAFPEKSVRMNGDIDPSERSSRPSVTRQYIGFASSNGVEVDSGSVPVINLVGTPAEQEFFPTESGNRLRNGTISRMNGALHNTESLERRLFVDDCDNRTPQQGMGSTVVLDKPNWHPSDSSESGSDQSPASSSSDWQDLSGRILFKLFDKNPGDFPQNAKAEIRKWLSLTPFCVETYIRPGCILLTVFLIMPRCQWKELVVNLRGSLERLLRCSHCDLWTTGRILVQVEQQRAFILDGNIRKIRLLRSVNGPILKSVRPLAVVAGEEATLIVRGHNLVPQAKILCVYHGKYVLHEVPLVDTKNVSAGPDSGSSEKGESDNQVQRVCFPGGPANVFGRCFIEVEHNLVGSILPVIVADSAICAELRSLEQELDSSSSRKQKHEDEFSADELYVSKEAEAISFLHELGWIFQSCYPLSCLDTEPSSQFKLSRFTALLKFAVLHNWCAVVKKLLDLLFSIGVKENNGSCHEVLQILSEVKLLHLAVKKRSRLMVELLLHYVPGGNVQRGQSIFTPVMEGPDGLTPLHVAASISNAEGIVDALTNDLCEVGLHAWKDAHDYSGRTPEWHALNSGNVSYAHLVDEKLISRQSHCVRITVGGVPQEAVNSSTSEGMENASRTREGMENAPRTRGGVDLNEMLAELPSFLSKSRTSSARRCKDCKTGSSLQYRAGARGTNGRMYRPFMMMLVAVATVCATVALLLKGPPHLDSIYYSLKWEGIKYGFL